MKRMLLVSAALLAAAPLAAAQTPDEVQLSVTGFEVAAHGAEIPAADKPAGVVRSTGPLTIGKPVVGVFSMFGCGSFAVTVPPHSFAENASAGWRVEVTPLKVVKHAVTFRLRWVRALDRSGALQPASEDVEVTLKPGESRPIDSVPVGGAGVKTLDGRPCDTKAASLRVSADFPDMDRRLFGAELWLVQRHPDGKVYLSHPQSIRGLFNRAIPFYFDTVATVAIPDKRIDVFGKLVADPVQGGIEISLEAIRAAQNADPEWGYWAARWVRSTLHVKPNEVVDIELPVPDDKSGPFADIAFSIRIKSKQIR